MISDWWSATNRTKKLFSALSLPETGRVLDLSCGEGELLNLVYHSAVLLQLSGVDMSESDITKAQIKNSNINFIVGRAEATDLESGMFDVIICSMAFHHYDHPLDVLNEIRRLIKPTGTVYIMDLLPKNTISQKIYNFIGCSKSYHFEKYYTTKDFKELTSQAGLINEREIIISYIPRLVTIELKVR